MKMSMHERNCKDWATNVKIIVLTRFELLLGPIGAY